MIGRNQSRKPVSTKTPNRTQNPEAMQLPQFTLRQLFASITGMCAGLGGIAFSLRKWNLPIDPAYHWLAGYERSARIGAFVVGVIVIIAAAVLLVPKGRRIAVAVTAILAFVPGAIVGKWIDWVFFQHESEGRSMLVGAILAFAFTILGSIFPFRAQRDLVTEPGSDGDLDLDKNASGTGT